MRKPFINLPLFEAIRKERLVGSGKIENSGDWRRRFHRQPFG
jgi:hypothetical protein